MSSSSGFTWPWQYNFPPFFTLQPQSETRSKQIESWRSLVLDYCQCKGITTLDLTESASCPLFHNAEINRRLPEAAIGEVFKELQACGNLEWTDGKSKRRCRIFWRSPSEWADMIYNYARENGLNKGGICTLYELTESDEVLGQPFYQLDKELLLKSLQVLEAENKAEIFEDNEGVKFF
ncbi:Vps25 [Caligus rogercresseyi]|uniref:Vacuolar protein-sorting-associated protein 25 n=1 Tax=Caligus rogercresseyi TaxID=217165 RepID=A0A7T8GPM8_CALRO|nr:Vps25 [Caligus rogercresseyi]